MQLIGGIPPFVVKEVNCYPFCSSRLLIEAFYAFIGQRGWDHRWGLLIGADLKVLVGKGGGSVTSQNWCLFNRGGMGPNCLE